MIRKDFVSRCASIDGMKEGTTSKKVGKEGVKIQRVTLSTYKRLRGGDCEFGPWRC
jgi:hypothetical protein